MASVSLKGSSLQYEPETEAQIAEIKKNRAYRDDLDIERAQSRLQRREKGVYIILPNADSKNKFTIVQATTPGKDIFRILELEIEPSKVKVDDEYIEKSREFSNVTDAMQGHKDILQTPYGLYR
ncbi:MAG: hypothetical protein KR126chlam4_00114 [Candidatus Anoxychlamydiales bacterium]|uniref:Uncharacterized protein n=1 Tax=marine sediment metagenome TaxID=412755 RepID=A0A0F9GCG8_9ZZZZ|nr:hypothetical protein [Candidatus Anoxychlamydiales bacterium]NGX40297.1 hypothetical protein [Candidatus Anoxychlamydiales bacterium]HEU63966.1 hypothetical protein [Chlamydiota bacterium]